MTPLLQLIEHGQSYWLDNLSRGIISSGELKRRVSEEGLRGITSNPTIFNKAISGSNGYDAQIKELVGEKRAVHEIYEALVVKDVQDACDILRPVYDESGGVDGFVSLEVSPYLAHDTHGTMEEARRLFNAVNRPNVFIKIPGTAAGVPAIEQMLYEGVNINITLLFSIQSYEAVAQAYIRALERRVNEGKPVNNIASVASFFLSRIDVLVDQLLGHLIVPAQTEQATARPEHLLGAVAIANAKLAYQSFKTIFHSERWQALAEKGARVQRPLWASTSTKNPLYHDVRYVEPLIGPNTVNTMPGETIAAFADHGMIAANSIEAELEAARQIFVDLENAGVDLDLVTQQLINEGVQKFIDPFDALMKTLANKRQEFLTNHTGQQTLNYGDLKSKITAAFTELDSQQFTRRLFAKDPSLWSLAPDEAETIHHRLGWLDSIEEFSRRANEVKEFAAEIKRAGFIHVVLLGMGGSSLCPEVCREVFGSSRGWPQLIILDTTDPAAIREVEAQIQFDKTLFLVASKSGTTVETISLYRYFYERARQQLGDGAGDHFVAITDPGTPLVEESRSRKFRAIFENPADIGGRYSALSYFGLVPMALMGIDITGILDNAQQMQLSCGSFIPAAANPGVSLGTLLGMNHRQGRDLVTFVLSDSVRAFGDWAEQLLAESTGKESQGLLSVLDESLGSPRMYGDDRSFIHLYTSDEKDKNVENKLSALEEAGYSVARIELRDKMSLGAEFYRWELATAVAGAIMDVNPFDEPNVAASKENTRELLQAWKPSGMFSEGNPMVKEGGLAIYYKESPAWVLKDMHGTAGVSEFLMAFLDLAQKTDYIALLPYFHRTPGRHRTLLAMLHKICRREGFKRAGTLGYGPRYLHSTGQLHKGGLNTGVFIMLTADADEDISIPGEDYGFATLQRAQALGDFRALIDKERRVIRIHLGKDLERGLKQMKESLA